MVWRNGNEEITKVETISEAIESLTLIKNELDKMYLDGFYCLSDLIGDMDMVIDGLKEKAIEEVV
jgi:hypothetical protein